MVNIFLSIFSNCTTKNWQKIWKFTSIKLAIFFSFVIVYNELPIPTDSESYYAQGCIVKDCKKRFTVFSNVSIIEFAV